MKRKRKEEDPEDEPNNETKTLNPAKKRKTNRKNDVLPRRVYSRNSRIPKNEETGSVNDRVVNILNALDKTVFSKQSRQMILKKMDEMMKEHEDSLEVIAEKVYELNVKIHGLFQELKFEIFAELDRVEQLTVESINELNENVMEGIVNDEKGINEKLNFIMSESNDQFMRVKSFIDKQKEKEGGV